MNTLPDEVLQQVFYDLADPSSLSRTSRRLYAFSQDPYVRAHYFIARHGNIQGLYFAFARGKLITPAVLDILISSGANFSRYFVQVACHHFFYTQSHFIKPSTPWCRSVSLATFSHFLALAANKYGDIPRGKNEDDGSLFSTFIKEAKFPLESQRVSWEAIRDIFEKYHFIPFCTRDPLMAQFPLALAIEPRLLPYAVANGFYMDAKYNDFIFRRMFERSSAPVHAHAEQIVSNVRELGRLDSSLFVTRTVAAEVCLEAKTNEAAYSALKQLDRSGDLAFSLTELVQDLIKLFVKARAITTLSSSQILTQLYTDFLAPPPLPAALASSRAHAPVDPSVRRAMLLTVFASDPPTAASAIPARLAPLRLGPLTLKDAEDILLSAFVERHTLVMEYLRREGVASGVGANGTRKVTHAELRTLAEDVAVRCLTREGKGKTLKRLCDAYPSIRGRIVQAVLGEHQVKYEFANAEEDEGRGVPRARLARQMCGMVCCGRTGEESDEESEGEGHEMEGEGDESGNEDADMEDDWSESEESELGPKSSDSVTRDLGTIGLEPLSTMIRRDEVQNGRGRRRYYPMYSAASANNTSRLPMDAHPVSRWIKSEFGALSSVTATFLTHAVINGNNSVLSSYLTNVSSNPAVPVTLKHFQIMAKLGTSSMDVYLYDRIKEGAKFYVSEDDYFTDAELVKKERETHSLVKAEPVTTVIAASPSPVRGKKRPRRSATVAVESYIVPDSDDEAIAAEEDLNDEFAEYRWGLAAESKRKAVIKVEPVETDLEAWIRALGELQKEEQCKYREEKKKRLALEQEKAEAEGPAGKIRVSKSDFLRSLTMNLRRLRELAAEKAMYRSVPGAPDVYDSDAEDDEYVVQKKAPKTKKRKTVAA